MNANEGLGRMLAHRKQHNKDALLEYKRQSKERLKQNVETKFNTTIIGVLAEIEKIFGFLWNQGAPKEELTDEELRMLRLKNKLRANILDNGHTQKRSALNEIEQYEVEWKRHRWGSDPDYICS